VRGAVGTALWILHSLRGTGGNRFSQIAVGGPSCATRGLGQVAAMARVAGTTKGIDGHSVVVRNWVMFNL
jgi:hypothetical protein